ncbi:MAG: hypothetical protein ABSD71_15560 [Bacteroidales bacterium]
MRTNLKKRSFILVLVVLTAITFFTLKSETQAVTTAFTPTLNFYSGITIIAAGPIGGGAFILLSGTSIPNNWYPCLSTQINQQLATAFTAISLGKTVMVYMDPGNAPYTIQGIFVSE